MCMRPAAAPDAWRLMYMEPAAMIVQLAMAVVAFESGWSTFKEKENFYHPAHGHVQRQS